MQLKRKATLFFLLALFFLLFSGSVFANDTEISWPTSPLTGIDLGSNTEFHELIAYLYGWGIGLGALFTFIMLVWGGFEYMTSAGDPGKLKNAIKRITTTLLGLALLLSSWLVLNTINPALTTLEPLPPLWDDSDYEDVELDYEEEDTACAFVILYDDPDFQGDEKKVLAGDTAGEHPIRWMGGVDKMSARGFREMNETEKQIVDQEGTARLEERGRVFHDGHIDGGACVINLYREKDRKWFTPWWWPDECGELAGTASTPSRNFDHAIFGEEADDPDIECLVVEGMSSGKGGGGGGGGAR